MNKPISNAHVPSTCSHKAAPNPISERDLALPALDGRWLERLTSCEIDSLLERRAPLLRNMLLASGDAATQSAIGVIDAAASYLSHDVDRLSTAALRARQAFVRNFLKVTFGNVASEIDRRAQLERGIVPVTDDAIGLDELVPSIEELQLLGAHLSACHGDRWEFLVHLMTIGGLRFSEAIALRFDSFQPDVDGSLTVHVVATVDEGGRGLRGLVQNMASRVVLLPPQLAKRLFELFGERVGASSEFVFVADGRQQASPGLVRRLLGSAMSRVGWSDDLLRSPSAALHRAWRTYGDSLVESLLPGGDGDDSEGDAPFSR